MYQSIPKPPIPAGQSPGIWLPLRSVSTVGYLTFVSKRLSAVGSKRISQFFDSADEPRSRVIALVDSKWVFLLLSFYIVLSWNMPLVKVWSKDKLNKKFVEAENFAELVSTVCFTCLEGGGFDPLWSSNGWGIWQHSGEFDQNFSKKSNARGFARGGGGHGRFWNWQIHNSILHKVSVCIEHFLPGLDSSPSLISFFHPGGKQGVGLSLDWD